MIFTFYLLKSVLAMSVLLAVYKLFLEKEKMHQFNRMYLIVAILLSFIVPILPTGLALNHINPTELAQQLTVGNIEFVETSDSAIEQGNFGFENVFIILYVLVFIFFSIKFSRNIFQLIYYILKHKKTTYKGAKIILLDRDVTPFTFMDYIFLNKDEFEGKHIDIQLIDHELAHVKQKHSLDIIFIEFLITVFWFNPILRWYKAAIQLNHEFLADEAVLNKYNSVRTYQYLLLDTIQNNNRISLASNINFHLTQKRLEMMTKKSSSMRKKILIFSLVPMLLGILLAFGNPVVSAQDGVSFSNELQGDPKTEKDRYFEHAVVHYNTKDGKTKVITYKSLSDEIKAKIPLPPPPPPVPHGTNKEVSKIEPLPKGTAIYLEDDGSVFIGNRKNGVETVPPPPPPIHGHSVNPPKPPKPPLAMKASKSPKPPMPPKAPNPPKGVNQKQAPNAPPPPPTTLAQLMEEGAIFYIDGKLASLEQTKLLVGEDTDNFESIEFVKDNDGKQRVYIVKK